MGHHSELRIRVDRQDLAAVAASNASLMEILRQRTLSEAVFHGLEPTRVAWLAEQARSASASLKGQRPRLKPKALTVQVLIGMVPLYVKP